MFRGRSATTVFLFIALVVFYPKLVHSLDTADLVFHNGTVVTMDGGQPSAEALAIQGETILAVGSDEEILALQGPNTIAVDLQGKTLLPGFVDPHTHIFNDAQGQMGMSLEEAQELVIQNGITTLGDAYITSDFLAIMQDFDNNGWLRIRTSLYMVYTDPCGNIIGDWYRNYTPTADPWAMLRIAGVKIFTDGGVCGLPAVSFQYPDSSGNGDLWFTPEELNQMVSSINDDGYQVIMHAIGDRAIEEAQNAIETALGGGENTLRHRIDHNSFAHGDLLPRYGEIGIVAAVFGYVRTCREVNDSLYTKFYGQDPVHWFKDWRSMLDAEPDFPITWHGDDPWAGPISPLLEMYNMVTGREIDTNGMTVCEPPDWLLEHTITAAEALLLFNTGGAYALFREVALGSLTPGKYADMIILSDNPLTVDPNAINEIRLLMTVVGGKAEYCRPGESALCGDFVANLASDRPVTASDSLLSNPPGMAVDGDLETYWSAGEYPPQWIEIDLEGSQTIDNIKLVVEQDQTGYTRHLVWGKGPEPGSDYVLLHEFDRTTERGDILSYTPLEPWENIRYIKVETTDSPSWVSLREIEVVRKVEPQVGTNEPGTINQVPRVFRLDQNYPNPFNPSTTIAFDVPGAQGETLHVQLIIYNIRGKQVVKLFDTDYEPGSHTVVWNGRNDKGELMSSGIYLYTLRCGDKSYTKKMVMLK